MRSSRTCPASPSRSMATVSSGNGGSPRRARHQPSCRLDHGAIGPYRYAARVSYALDDGALVAALHGREPRADRACPTASASIPGSRGTPARRFMRRPGASGWRTSAICRPASNRSTAHPAWDFSRDARPLPQRWVNNGFDGWDGRAEITQPEDGVVLSIAASAELGVYILYSPASGRRLLLLRAGVASRRRASRRGPHRARARRDDAGGGEA